MWDSAFAGRWLFAWLDCPIDPCQFSLVKTLVEPLGDLVAIARGMFQVFPVHDPYVPAAILNQAALLQRTRNQSDGRSLSSQHFSEELLGEIQSIGLDPVLYH